MPDPYDKKLQQLNTLIEMTALINSTLDPYMIKTKVIEAASKLLDTESGSLMLIDQETKELYFEVTLGEKTDKLRSIRVKKGSGIAGWVAEHGEPLIIHDVASDPRFYKGVDEKSGFNTKNMICVPVMTKGKMVGVLQAINKKEGGFEDDDMVFLYALANHVAVAIENSQLYQRAITDSLTGLYHHEHFKLMLREEMERSRKYKYPLALLLMDIDFFKKINDGYGHLAGDMVLKRIAEVLKYNTRKGTTRWGDTVARYGGEEFAVILPYSNYTNAFRVGERIRKTVEETNFDKIKVTISIGAGYFNAEEMDYDYEKFIGITDRILYKAKDKGRNRVEIADSQ